MKLVNRFPVGGNYTSNNKGETAKKRQFTAKNGLLYFPFLLSLPSFLIIFVADLCSPR